ncbi:hypothetical protein [Bifidobacterium sp.]|jgi:hypothetical protein|uniref:hypothetical protein n=1 Tax=Bifidobacterium sp. TaxID=41200 RepID=UPI0025C47288|nr:hypothetical protein [Bifidobacterium sp.]MCI1635180.1 hypothetical protein [Bifidobacterium sp.]
MSITEQEAERRWPRDEVYIDLSYPRFAVRGYMQSAFIDGAEWQAQREPTEAEIEAAAVAMCEEDRNRGGHIERMPHWDEAKNSLQKKYREYARIALAAARKAVSVDE